MTKKIQFGVHPMVPLEAKPERMAHGFGPEFAARYPGECSSDFCDDPDFEEGEYIRADGNGGYICADCADTIINEEDEDV